MMSVLPNQLRFNGIRDHELDLLPLTLIRAVVRSYQWKRAIYWLLTPPARRSVRALNAESVGATQFVVSGLSRRRQATSQRSRAGTDQRPAASRLPTPERQYGVDCRMQWRHHSITTKHPQHHHRQRVDLAVTAIAESAFSGTGLDNVTIPNNVTTIGDEAFKGITGPHNYYLWRWPFSSGYEAFFE